MSIFKSSKITTVGTSVTRAIEDKNIPNSILTGGTLSLMSNSDLVPTVLTQITDSIALKADRFYKYGRDNYIHGLPSGQFVSTGAGSEEIAIVLASVHNVPLDNISIVYNFSQSINFLHFGWMKLINLYGYNQITNELPVLSAIKGFPVHLDDLVLHIPAGTLSEYSAESLAQWGIPPNAGFVANRRFTSWYPRSATNYVVDDTITELQFKLSYSWITGNVLPGTTWLTFQTSLTVPLPIQRESIPLFLDSFDPSVTYLQVKYLLGTEIKYAIYNPSTGVFPTLNNLLLPPPTTGGQFYPFTYLRFNGISEGSNPSSAEYLSSEKLLKKIGMTYADIEAGVNATEDMGNIEQGIMMFSVPAESTNPIELKYLFEFFNSFPEFAKVISQPTLYNFIAPPVVAQSLVIQDKRFKLTLEADSLFKRRVAGVIGTVGTHTVTVTGDKTFTESTAQTNYTDVLADPAIFTYRKQTTPYFYDEVVIENLQVRYHIYSRFSDASYDDKNIRIIPLDHSIVKNYSTIEREELLSRSIHFIMNTVQITKVSWWQKGLFAFILDVVRIFVFVYGGVGLSQGLIANSVKMILAAASNVAIYIGTAVVVLRYVLLGVIISLATREVAKLIGLEVTVLIAILSIAASYAIPSSSTTSIKTTSLTARLPTAQTLLELGSGLLSGVQSAVAQGIKGIQKEFEELALLKEAAEEEFELANKLLNPETASNYLTPFVIFGESPDDYYNRTIHSGNIGVLSIDAVSSYVDIALMLPKLKDTIGGTL